MTSDSPPELEPLGSRYLLGTSLGSGAMGQVSRATTREGEPVAIKVLRPELSTDPGIVTRFLQERQILESLSDPHLVRVLDLVAEGSKLAIVMDLIDGPDLRTELARRGTFRPIEAAEIVDGLLSGLAAVHAGGVVHRDIKPENVLLSGGQPGGVRLTDFGIARIVEEGQKSRRTTVVGTPDYLAPEVADGAQPTRASDLYAVGIMLYELVAGVTPFAGGSPLAVLRRHAEQQPVRPDGMPEGIWRTVAALLAKDPAQRPADAAQVRAALAAAAPSFAQLPAMRPLEEPPAPTATAQHTVMSNRADTQTLPADVAGGQAPAPRRRRTGLLIAGVAAVVLLLVAGVVTFLVLRSSGSSSADAAPSEPVATTESTSAAPTTPATATPSSSTSSAPADEGIVPSVVGLPVSEAQRALRQAGLDYEVQDTIDDSVADNTVTVQDPAEGASLAPGGTVTLTVARPSVGVFVDTLAPVSSNYYTDYDTGLATSNGQTYLHAVTTGLTCSSPARLEYDLGRHYNRFTATVGLSDDSSSAASLRFEVLIDGQSLRAETVGLGQPIALDLDVSGGLRLELSAVRLDGKCNSSGDTYSTVVFGDAELFGAAGQVPTAPATPTN